MMLALGLCAYGTARLLQRQGGYLALVVGLAAVTAVRPHMAVLVAVALSLAWLRRRRPAGRAPARPVLQAAGLAVLLAGSLFVLGQAERFFGVEGQGVAAAEDVFDETVSRTSQQGSAFDAPAVRSPVDVPLAVVTVLFRPLPFEAHNPQALLAALEGTALLGLFVVSARRLGRLPRQAWRTPYLLFATVYSLLFIIAFSNIGNFGILTRQRVQLLPLALLVLAVPASDRTPAPSAGDGSAAGPAPARGLAEVGR